MATAKLLLCRLTENVACYSVIFLLEIRFVNFSPGLFQEYLFLYYAVHFLASFCQKFPHKMWIQWTDWATAVCSWSWFSRQRRPYRVRALVMIEIGAKIEVLDLVYPPSCLPSWSNPLSYRKLPIKRYVKEQQRQHFLKTISVEPCFVYDCMITLWAINTLVRHTVTFRQLKYFSLTYFVTVYYWQKYYLEQKMQKKVYTKNHLSAELFNAFQRFKHTHPVLPLSVC